MRSLYTDAGILERSSVYALLCLMAHGSKLLLSAKPKLQVAFAQKRFSVVEEFREFHCQVMPFPDTWCRWNAAHLQRGWFGKHRKLLAAG